MALSLVRPRAGPGFAHGLASPLPNLNGGEEPALWRERSRLRHDAAPLRADFIPASNVRKLA